MKLAALAAFAVLAATPALADPAYSDSMTTSQSSIDSTQSSTDADVAAKDAARQSYYQNKLDAANAQAKEHDAQAQAQQAQTERQAALDRADQDRSQIQNSDQTADQTSP